MRSSARPAPSACHVSMPAETILNRKALRDFHILERYEAGIELKGSEVKSIRAGKANIGDAFARIEKGEAFLYNADIQPYERASHEVPAPKRVRKLLLHRQRDRQTLWRDEHRGPHARHPEALLEKRAHQSRDRSRPGQGVAHDKRARPEEAATDRERETRARFNRKHG